MNYNYGNADYEKLAAEYLVAFIKHLYRKGKNSYEISEILEIDYDLIGKLLKNDKMLEALKLRDMEFINTLKQQFPELAELQSKCREYGIYYHESSYGNPPSIYISGISNYLKNIGPWQRQNYFTDPLKYYFGRKKRKYTNSDLDVLTKLSTGKKIMEEQEKLTDRDLTPAYRLRIINDLADGCGEEDLSRKYNCSIAAVKLVADEYELLLPFSEKSIVARIVKAIKQGYAFELLTKRFYNSSTDLIENLIKTHRIEPASEGKSTDYLEE
jgi:hypothetical protein